MKIALRDGKVILAEIDPLRFEQIKRIGTLRWNRRTRTYTGSANRDTLDALAAIFPLPSNVEGVRKRLAYISGQIEEQRNAENPAPLYPYPVKGQLYKHQIRGANMAMMTMTCGAKPGGGFGLLFEMGCGKTLTAIAIAGALYRSNRIARVLVAAPTTVCDVWAKDLARFAAFNYTAEVLLGDKKQRLAGLKRLNDWQASGLKIAVINYESTWREGIQEALLDYHADLVICDESQRIKTHNAAQSKAMHRLGDLAAYRLILSGTPVQNNAVDIYSQYRFLDPGVFGGNFYAFKNRYCVMGGYGQHQIVGYRHTDDLIRKIYSIAYRVTKEECLDLPAQTFQSYTVQFSKAERAAYDQLRRSSFVELEGDKSITATTVLTKILRLAQLTGGFYTADGEERPTQANSAKLDALDEILDDYVLGAGQKLVIFARFRAEVKAICALLEKKGIRHGSIWGDVPQADRGAIAEDFQTNPETKAFVAQIQTAGLGITLHAASVAVFYSLDFNYSNYAQALARIHRIGQQYPVTYIHLLVENTIDAKTLDVLAKKENLAESIVDNWRAYFQPTE